jgi:hypothetical protein
MKNAYRYATLLLCVSTLGLAFGGCEGCPAGTQLQQGVCKSLPQRDADAATSEAAITEPTGETASATEDPERTGTNNGSAGASSEPPASAQAVFCAGNAGKAVCDEHGALRMCESDDSATLIADCRSPELCEAGRSRGSCAVCTAGEAKCNGAMLMRCGPDGSAYVPESDCKSAQLCDPRQGQCNASVCEADAYSCDGDRLSVCKPDLTGYQFSKQCPPGLCDAEKKACKQCAPGAMSCDGSTVMLCDGLGETMEAGPSCEGMTPVCDETRGCVECKATGDCKAVHDCADLAGCGTGACQYVAKPRRTALGNGDLVRSGNPDPDPIYVVYGGALFYIASEDELTNNYGGFGKVQIKALNYARCPVQGTLIMERGDTVGYIYVSDGKQLNWVKNPADLESYCGGSASIVVVPAGSLTTTLYPPPAGLCPVNKS